MIGWGWIPNLTGDLGIDYQEFKIQEIFIARNCIEHDGFFRSYKETSDIKGKRKKLIIDYKLPEKIYLDEIQFNLIDDVSGEVVRQGKALIRRNGLVRIEIPGKDTPTRKIIFEVYMNLKEIFHKHVCHRDDKNDGADSLLLLEATVSEGDAIKNIAAQYERKVSLYLNVLNEEMPKSQVNKTSDKDGDNDGSEFYKMYLQARVELLYGLCFLKTFSDKLGTKFDQYNDTLSRGIQAVDTLYSTTNDLKGINISEEMKNANVRVKNLTYYVLAFAIIAVLTPFFSILKDHFSDLNFIFDVVFVIFVAIILVLMFVYSGKDHKNEKNKSVTRD